MTYEINPHYPLDSIEADDIDAQASWSEETFGPGTRIKGNLAHIRKELAEIEADPQDIEEWADLIILAFDGATRQGFTGQEIVTAYHRKTFVNQNREWPDWREFSQDEPIEHVRSEA